MKTKSEWDVIWQAAQAQHFRLELYQFTMGAEENAHATVYLEKAQPESEYYTVCFDSLISLLSFSEDTVAHEFFRGIGVRF